MAHWGKWHEWSSLTSYESYSQPSRGSLTHEMYECPGQQSAAAPGRSALGIESPEGSGKRGGSCRCQYGYSRNALSSVLCCALSGVSCLVSGADMEILSMRPRSEELRGIADIFRGVDSVTPVQSIGSILKEEAAEMPFGLAGSAGQCRAMLGSGGKCRAMLGIALWANRQTTNTQPIALSCLNP
jgi:hypothetical protein